MPINMQAALSTTLSNMNNEPVKYKAYLQKGFDLLKLNYSLLSYISALGAYRDRMKKFATEPPQFLSGFYPVAKKIIYTLEHIEEIPEAIFNQQQESIETHLKELEKQEMTAEERAVFSLPYQQLNLITQLLPQFYEYFRKESC
ncbi:inner membrane protein [Haemophilus influenzae]|uniref:Inner membrane protein n=1 Tax=Haemophilus influenzae TaxID=727 RepID=A0A2X1RMJ2_HAEIF|nr:inner membrane protein [Haemophilus influenzae]